jgi:hypothetical protein
VIKIKILKKNKNPHNADFFYFFAFFFPDTGLCDAVFLYSLYNAATHAYANNADNAVIIPATSPSEKTENKTIDIAKTTVYPKF